MKHSLLIMGLALLASAGTAAAQDTTAYELRTLTFEDADVKSGFTALPSTAAKWSDLIASEQFSDSLLYAGGKGSSTQYYSWTDGGNTMLHNELSKGYGSYCYWSGGHAISNYGSSDFKTYGNDQYQLTVYNTNAQGMTRTGNGHNGSDHFAMHYGYFDGSLYGLGEDALPTLSFADGVSRVIDHMWVTNSCYAYNCFVNGNGLTGKITAGQWVKLVATAFDAQGNKTGKTAEIYLCNGPEDMITDWVKWDLSTLGEVAKISLNVTGNSDNGYGFSQPAYFAYDDVAVRFPTEKTGVSDVTAQKTVASVTYVNLQGQVSNQPFEGVNVRVVTYTDGTKSATKLLKR